MITPTIAELTKNGEINRYELVQAVAKCARLVTDEYVAQRQTAEQLIANRETDKTIAAQIKPEYCDEKAVKTAIGRFYTGRYQIIPAQEEN